MLPITAPRFVAMSILVVVPTCSLHAEEPSVPAALSRLGIQEASVLSAEEAASVRGEGNIFVGAQFDVRSLVFPDAAGLGNFAAIAGGTAIDVTSKPRSLTANASGTFQVTDVPGAGPQQGLRPNLAGGKTTGDYVFGNGFLYNKRTGQGFQFSGGSYIRYNGTRADASLFGQGFLTTIGVQGNGVLNGAPNSLNFTKQ